jgi:uncharacterized damage-inducible protein DinB
MPQRDPSIRILVELLDQAFDLKAWHGPNLRGAIRRLTADQAAWRPRPGRHSIADIVVHCAYWKYAVRRKLRGDARGGFAIKGSNWFPQPDDLSESDWKLNVAILCEEHTALRAAVADLDPELLMRRASKSRYTYGFIVQGAAAHDLYHTGQIQVLKRLQA